jgi:hypothetical protein
MAFSQSILPSRSQKAWERQIQLFLVKSQSAKAVGVVNNHNKKSNLSKKLASTQLQGKYASIID